MSNVHLDKQNPDSKIVIGLTGNIGTGKSTVMRMLAELGAIGIDADKVAHEVVMPGELAYGQVLAEFGHEIAPNGGPIDRARLGQIVFSNPTALARLEAIVHPAVSERISRLVADAQAPVVVIEAIKLLEAGLSVRLCNQVWVVTAPRSEQIRRLMATRGRVCRRQFYASMRSRLKRKKSLVPTLSSTTAAAWRTCGNRSSMRGKP